MADTISFVVVFFGNYWIWKIVAEYPLLAFLLLLSSVSLFIVLRKQLRLFVLIFQIAFVSILFIQWFTTDKIPLTYLNNHDQYIQQMRLKQYPPVKFSVLDKTIWIPMAHWFEGRTESIAFHRLSNNLSWAIDINLYFFANHPRQRVGIKEFEKFPFLVLPLFIYGVFSALKVRKKLMFLSILPPIILISFIGHRNGLGPFSLFPVFVASIAYAMKKLHMKLSGSTSYLSYSLSVIFLIIMFINLIQIILYERYF